MNPQVDINKVIQKYQVVLADLQLQNILLKIQLEESNQLYSDLLESNKDSESESAK